MLSPGDIFHDGQGYCLVYQHWHKGRKKYILRYIRLYNQFKDNTLLNKHKGESPVSNISNLNEALSMAHKKDGRTDNDSDSAK